jgi:hypothetical protein
VVPGSYATISRAWASGDVVDIALPMALTRESTPDSASTQAVKYGPILLAGAYGTNNLSGLPTLNPATLQPSATPLQFTGTASTGQVTLLPFYKVHGQRYSVYWNIAATLPPLVAHYQFNETSGTTAADSSGNGRNATVTSPATWVTGRAGNAISLSGSSQYVTLPAGILSGAGACSVAVWVRLDTQANWARLFDFGSGTTANMFFVPRSGSNTARFAITSSGAGGEQRLEAAALATGAWTHVAVTLGANTGVLYLNGVEAARNTAMTLTPGSLGATNQNWVGRSQYSGDPYLDGAVDSLRLYSRVLTAAEVSNLYSTGQ